jgi:hypothetical protein
MRRERRKNFRVEWNSRAAIDYGTITRSCVLVNFSNGGARIAGVRASTIPDEFTLRITGGHGGDLKCRVLARSVDSLRVKFIDRFRSRAASNARRAVPEPAR